MSRQLAVDYAGKVRVNCVCPGTVDTPFVEAYLEKYHKHEKEKVRAELNASASWWAGWGVPMRSRTRCSIFVRREAEFVTGSAMVIDGGWTAA